MIHSWQYTSVTSSPTCNIYFEFWVSQTLKITPTFGQNKDKKEDFFLKVLKLTPSIGSAALCFDSPSPLWPLPIFISFQSNFVDQTLILKHGAVDSDE